MIWKSEHLNKGVKKASIEIQNLIRSSNKSISNIKIDQTVGIIGGGPKGMYALEELLRSYQVNKIKVKTRIYWWNESIDFGSGPNYRTTQPDFLLINYCIGHIDAWDRTNGAQSDKLSLVQWLEENKSIDVEVQPIDYASRALVGLYLQNTLLKIIQSIPNSIELILVNEMVNDIYNSSTNLLQVKTSHRNYCVDYLLLATGHCYQNKPLIKGKKNNITENYFTSSYPIEQLNKIPANKKVGIIGWGLTFIDVVLALTEGRGGKFDEQGNYSKSGNEPILIPFSRNQLPIIPRGPIYGNNIYRLKYINEHWLMNLKIKFDKEKIDFKKVILPQLEKELRFAYYSTLLQTRDENIVEEYINSISNDKLFSYNNLLFPKLKLLSSVQETYINHLEDLINEAEKGELKSPLMAATAVWREASLFIADLYKFGGFNGESQQLLDYNLFGAFCRTSYGPPIENMRKILTLLKAGIIQTYWLNKVNLEYSEKEKMFHINSIHQNVNVDYIVDARIARPQLNASNSSLYNNMYKNDLIKPFDNEGYNPGCADLNHLGKLNHKNNSNIYFYGSNTEGLLLDNDTLSRKKNNLAKGWVNAILNDLIIHQNKTT